MDLHIGEIIKKRSRDMRVGPTALGRRINTSKQNVYGIFQRKSLDTDLLLKISLALDYDFFALYQEALRTERSQKDHRSGISVVALEERMGEVEERLDRIESELESK